MTNTEAKEIIEKNRPYDSAWGMYYDEFDDATPDEIDTIIQNQEEMDRLIHKTQ